MFKPQNVEIKLEASAMLPTKFGNFKINVYANNLNDKNDLAIIKEPLDLSKPVMVRMHSECLTGDIMGSLKCDCGDQLHCALSEINQNGSGIVLYLRQEGRGIGLVNKIKAYNLQDQGYDTIEANLKLGFEPDMRTYEISYAILKDLKVKEVNLLTNNPDKVEQLKTFGINVIKIVPLKAGINDVNADYLKVKRDQMHHMFGEEIDAPKKGESLNFCEHRK